LLIFCIFFFFFQAEDGIRDRNVTGVQTCALPIYKARLHLNNYQSDMSKFQLMRFLFALIFCGALTASPLQAQESSPTVPPAAAESGKEVVHALNTAFAKVFEIVAPGVVMIEASKKNDGNEGLNFGDLSFQGQPDDNS